MGRFDTTKQTIDANIKTNGNQAITGQVLNSVMKDMLSATDAELTELSARIVENEVLIEDLQNTKIEKENDDYYPKMAVGLADNLAGVDVVDSEINFRRSGGGAISDGVARIESIKGNSVVWNQVFRPNIFAYGAQFVKTEDDSLTMEAIKEPSEKFVMLYDLYMGIASHKYLLALDVVSGSYTEGETRMEIFGYVVQPNVPRIIALSEAKKIGATLRVVGCIGMRFRVRTIDLTQMFGAGNEPTTIEEFYQRIPMGVDMNAYNEGEVIHMDVQSIESVGVNQWDEEWENGSINTDTGANVTKSDVIRTKNFIPVIEGGKYYYKCPSSGTALSFCYDDKYNVVEKYLSNKRTGLASTLYNAEFTVPQGVHYIKFYVVNTYGTTYNHDICINLSDPSINGKYYPHIKRVEDLSVIRKYFPQGMKSAGTAHDEIRYNKASGKWEKVVRIGEVDLGTLSYKASIINNAEETYTVCYTYDLKNIVKIPSYRAIANILTHQYLTAPTLSLFDYVLGDKTIMLYNDGTIYVRDTAHTDAASFTAAMQGVMLYYELAEPIVTELDEADQFKDLDYQVWNAGTEKAIAEGKSAPLAADITYGFNAIGKIKELESLVAALRAKVGI